MLITNNEKALRTKCEDVKPEEVESLIKILEAELDKCNRLGKSGIGLAAPQIGIFKKIAIIRLDEKNSINLVNCNIEKAYNPFIFKDEGCLSFPGKSEDTTRFEEVYITNNLVHPNSFIAKGLFAVVCQHEIDHYNGSLFIDHVIPKQKPVIVTKVGPNEPCVCGSGKKYKKCCRA